MESDATDVALPETFADFYARDHRSLVGLAFVLTGSHWVAEDLANDAMIEAHKRWQVVSTYDDPGAWVRRVLVNKSTSRFRRLKSETKAVTRLAGRRTEQMELKVRTGEVWTAVRALPARQAQTIALFYWDDYSIAQIAEVLDCSTETVKTHLKRARSALSEKLESFAQELS